MTHRYSGPITWKFQRTFGAFEVDRKLGNHNISYVLTLNEKKVFEFRREKEAKMWAEGAIRDLLAVKRKWGLPQLPSEEDLGTLKSDDVFEDYEPEEFND